MTQAKTTLRIRGWAKFQHYSDRNPPWIKLHFELLSSRDWVMLDDASRVLAIACMLIASRSEGERGTFEADPDYLQRVAYLNQPPDFMPLIDCGFLETLADASTVLADARPETETETETETEVEVEGESEREISKTRVPRSTPAKQQKRAHQWPHDSFPGDYLARAHAKGYTEAQALEMGAAFLDHHLARGSTFKDWHRAWGTWMRNERKFNGKAQPGGSIVADIDDIPF